MILVPGLQLALNLHFFRSTESRIRICERKPSQAGVYHVLTRRYYVHGTYNLYHRIIVDIQGMCVQLIVISGNVYTVESCNYAPLHFWIKFLHRYFVSRISPLSLPRY